MTEKSEDAAGDDLKRRLLAYVQDPDAVNNVTDYLADIPGKIGYSGRWFNRTGGGGDSFGRPRPAILWMTAKHSGDLGQT